MLRDEQPTTQHDFGTCCICVTEGCEANPVRTMIQMQWTCPVPGTGWGCVQCGVPADGALVVLCDHCAEKIQNGALSIKSDLHHVVSGELAGKGRMDVETWRRNREAFSHDFRKHDTRGMMRN
jgi:hypothetical protein